MENDHFLIFHEHLMTVVLQMVNYRRLLGEASLLDYDYTGPNPKHDPRKGGHP